MFPREHYQVHLLTVGIFAAVKVSEVLLITMSAIICHVVAYFGHCLVRLRRVKLRCNTSQR